MLSLLGLGQHRQRDAVHNGAGSPILHAGGCRDREHGQAVVAQRIEVIGIIPVQLELRVTRHVAEGGGWTRAVEMKDLEAAIPGNRQDLARRCHVHISNRANIYERHIGRGAGGAQISRAADGEGFDLGIAQITKGRPGFIVGQNSKMAGGIRLGAVGTGVILDRRQPAGRAARDGEAPRRIGQRTIRGSLPDGDAMVGAVNACLEGVIEKFVVRADGRSMQLVTGGVIVLSRRGIRGHKAQLAARDFVVEQKIGPSFS
jgi:hypothetical protein